MKTLAFALLIAASALAQTPTTPPKRPLGVPADYERTIEAYIDGPSMLCFTRTGFYWRNGENAKPGRIDGKNHPTFVNGNEWFPAWKKPKYDRGADYCAPVPWAINDLQVTYETVLISKERNGPAIERSKPNATKAGQEFVITFNDPEPGAAWYKIKVKIWKN